MGAVVTGILGWVGKGLFTRKHIKDIEEKRKVDILDLKEEIAKLRVDGKVPPVIQISGDQIVVNRKPVARFTQDWTALDTCVPLDNGQIVTFFAPKVHVEYTDGEREPVELQRATFQELANALTEAVSSGEFKAFFEGLSPLSVKPDALRAMLAEAEADNSPPARPDGGASAGGS